MAKLSLYNMEFYAFHGHFKEENVIGGRFRVDVEIETDISKAAASDDLSDALDYGQVYEVVKKEMRQVSRIIENVANRIMNSICSSFPGIEHIKVTVAKINPPVGGKMDHVSVTLSK
jgi:7,8-dihydroneopterin aldolase/epimerase/oxygenase